MASDLEAPKEAEAHLERHFAELCRRVKRVDLAAHGAVLALAVLIYALVVGWFDWFVVDLAAPFVPIVRWSLFGIFTAALAIVLLQTVRCFIRRVNPYYIAHRLEQTHAEAKNSLINWLDLHDQGLPSAFQRNLSARAADNLDAMDAEQTLPRRRNRALLIALAPPALGLLILFVLGPGAFLNSMLRAFLPFYTPAEIARTRITILEPAGGDAEIGVQQAIAFAAKIEGHVPAAHRPDAPRLLYRYQASEDYFALPLRSDGNAVWSAELAPSQGRTGFLYKITAGNAETPEHQIRLRGPAHIKKFEVTYQYRPYLKLPKKTVEFPTKTAATPTIHGLRGTEVELILHASRPVKKAQVEVISGGATVSTSVRIMNDPTAFTCRFTLDQPGSFRVRFTTADGEENIDRGEHPIDVHTDAAPTVILTSPAKDVALPVDGTLEIEGRASDDFGVKELALHLRVLTGSDKLNLQPKVYRPDKSLQFADGTYPDAIDYKDFLALDELQDDKGTIHLLSPGTVLEYWLEAIDNADYPAGNIGRSAAYKITLLPKSQDAAKAADDRKKAQENQASHKKQQDDRQKPQQNQKQDSKGGGSQAGGNDPKPDEKKLQQDKDKIKQALQSQDQKQPGDPKNGDQQKDGKKDGTPDAKKSDQKGKSDSEKSPGKQGDKKNDGNSKGNGDQMKNDAGSGKSKDGNPKSKDGDQKKDADPKNKNNQGDAKEGGNKGKPDAKAPAKDDPKSNEKPDPGQSKDPPNKDDGPNAKGKSPDKGEAKDGPPQPSAGKEPDGGKKDDWDRLQDLVKKLGKKQDADEVVEALVAIAKNTDEPDKSELAKDILAKNGRDPNTGKEMKKAPNLTGGKGQSPGLSDDLKADAANREFLRRIGQMQLDDWKKRVTPDVLKKAGMSEADWRDFVKNMQAYDEMVRKRNAEILRKNVQERRGKDASSGGIRTVEGTPNAADPVESRSPTPPELLDARRRFTEKQ